MEFCRCSNRDLKIEIYTAPRKYSKPVTIVAGIDSARVQQVFKRLKSLCACGGTVKSGNIEIQGDHVEKVRKFLTDNHLL